MTARLIIAGTRDFGFRHDRTGAHVGEPTPEAGCRAFALLDEALDGLVIAAVLSGGCVGMDLAGELWAMAEGIPVEHYPADWKTHGKAAGPMRNQAMVDAATHLLVVRYADSRGSADVLRRARKAGLTIVGDVDLDRRAA